MRQASVAGLGRFVLRPAVGGRERARQCGFRMVADTTVRLWHIGSYAFGWEDAGMERPRVLDVLRSEPFAAAGSLDQPPGRWARTRML